jgi:peptidoglycan/xylan/chitin deacetylase (PgdA/CDA1 family)
MKQKISLIFITFWIYIVPLQAENLLRNSDFESGKNYWIIEQGSQETLTNDSFHGQKALCYQTGGIDQDIADSVAIVPGEKYILSGYYKTTGSVEGIWLGLVYMDENWNSVGESELSLNPREEDYTPFLHITTAPAHSRYLTLWTWSDAPNGGKTYFDFFSLRKETQNNNNHTPHIIPVAEQQNNLGDTISLQVNAQDEDGDILIYALNGFDEEVDININPKTGLISGVASKPGNYRVRIDVTDNNGAIAQYSFNWIIKEPQSDPCNLLRNGNFETNLYNWDLYAQYTLDTNAHNGEKALLLKNGGLDQTIQLLNHKTNTYQFYGYYKTEGNIEGAWVGIIFYDENGKELSSQEISLKKATTYQKFILNATSPENTHALQVWIWMESNQKGKLFMDDLKISQGSCYDYVVPSSLPPKGIAVSKSPQFVTIGFDDNTKAEGIDWAINLFSNKKNPDGSNARVSFYMNTKGFHEWIDDDPAELLNAVKRLKNTDHEIGNHTYCHHSDLQNDDWDTFTQTINALTSAQWQTKLQKATNDLKEYASIPKSEISGFRAPYLLYNQNLFDQLKKEGFLYDCSIEEGAAEKFDGTNFRWPYQLNEGSPGHNESWYGNSQNPNFVKIGSIPGLWELPNHLFMIPKDTECKAYGIKKGLWKRIKQKLPYLEDYKITGFDYNLWNNAELNKEEVLGILKYNLDLRLKGNHAPLMFGAHTQYYTQAWADAHSPNANYLEMRAAISEFIDYALSKPEVRIVPAKDIINWCTNPVPLN